MTQHVAGFVQPAIESYAQPKEANKCEASANRSELEDQIRTLESHLRSLPDADLYRNVRRQMAQEISDAKSKINAAKPVGLRLESCWPALKRAEDRHVQA